MAMASQKLKAAVMALALVVLAAGTGAEDMLFNGETLQAGQFLEKLTYQFIMQTDCNLVLYVNGSKALWASGTNGKGTSCKATLQNNGNLVVLAGSGDVVWSSGSARGPNTYHLILQGDGNVVIYGGALWATNTVQSKRRSP